MNENGSIGFSFIGLSYVIFTRVIIFTHCQFNHYQVAYQVSKNWKSN